MITSASLRTVTNKIQWSAKNWGSFLLSWENCTSCYGKAMQIMINKKADQMGGLCIQRITAVRAQLIIDGICNKHCSAREWGLHRRSLKLSGSCITHRKGCLFFIQINAKWCSTQNIKVHFQPVGRECVCVWECVRRQHYWCIWPPH